MLNVSVTAPKDRHEGSLLTARCIRSLLLLPLPLDRHRPTSTHLPSHQQHPPLASMRFLSVAIVLSVAFGHFLVSPAPAVSAMPVAILRANNDQPMNLGALAKRQITHKEHTAQPHPKGSRFPAAVQIDNTVEGVLVSHTERSPSKA